MASSSARRWALPFVVLATGLSAFGQEPPEPVAPTPHPVRGMPGSGRAIAQTGFVSSGLRLMSWRTLSDFGSHSSGNDCWGYTSPSGREYALIGLSDGTGVVEITDPGQPQILTTLPGPNSLWRDIKVYQDHAYAVSEGGSGIQVFDLGAIDSGTVTQVNTILTPGTNASHNVAIDETSGFLYRLGGGSTGSNLGLRAYTLSNPAAPAFVGQWNLAYIHDAQVVTYTSGPFAGRQIAFACTDGAVTPGLDIIDVTNKLNMFRITRVVYGNPAFSHQVWLSPDLQYAYLNDELDENGTFPSTTYIFDVSDINNPFEVTPAFNNGSVAITHNLYTRGNFIYQANYTSGLRIYDATNPTSLTEVAFFDTFPGSDPVSFDGLWSVFPYFTNDQLLIGSDLQSGLFVWWHGAPQLTFDFPSGVPDQIEPSGETVVVQILEQTPGLLQGATPTLHYDVGAGEVTVPLASLGGSDWSAAFPAQPCGTSVEFWITAESTDGITWSSPEACGSLRYDALYAEGLTAIATADFETSSGWVSGAPGDNATTGLWVRGNPNGTAVQPEDDHTDPPGTQCWFTGQGSVGGTAGQNDVDNGITTLLSQVYDLSTLQNPLISYWRWYANNGNGVVDDVFRVDVSNDGSSWVNVETLGPTGPDSTGGWLRHAFVVSDFVAPSATVRLRFVAADVGGGSIVEAAIDDVVVSELSCGDVTTYCTGKTTSQGCVPFLSSSGTASVSGGPFQLIGNNHVEGESAFLIYSFKKANLDFHGGKLCVKSPFMRIASLVKANDGQPCVGCAQPTCREFRRNFNQLVQSGLDPLLTAGQTVFTQYRQRDPADPLGFGDNLTDGATFVIAP